MCKGYNRTVNLPAPIGAAMCVTRYESGSHNQDIGLSSSAVGATNKFYLLYLVGPST